MIRILLIEDNAGDARLVQEYLGEPDTSEAYDLTHLKRINDAIDYLSQPNEIDVIISDIALPDSHGTQSFQKLRKVAANLPVIFSTGTHDEEMAASALQRGAQDYLLKGVFDGESLRRSIRYSIERKKFQNEVEAARKHARRLRARANLLKQQREQLLEVGKAKDDFISLASHQLRTPATGVKQYLGLVLEGYAGDISQQQREFLELAYDSNERQLKIVSDLLRTAQLDAGHVNLAPVQTDLTKLLNQIVEEQTVQIRARDQHINVKTPDKATFAKVDGGKLRMAVENLVDNASKYTPHGKHIFVELEQAKNTRITIRDEGVGIENDDLPKIFDKFSRANNPLSREVGGSGLGLYWVKKIIDLHGGSIDVKSAAGQGTSFIITLP